MIAAVTRDAIEIVRALAPPEADVRPLTADDLTGAAFVVPAGEDREVLEALSRSRAVEVVQTLSAGTDWIEPFVPARAVLCSASGSRDVPVAEWVVGALLGASTGLLRSARAHRWIEPATWELSGRTVVILGHGSIGEATRVRLEALGARVEAVARRARPGVHAVEELGALLPRADALVVLLPLTDGTRGVVDAEMLAALPDGALVLNAGRGAVLDTDALVRETADGRLRAVLDVAEPEPLPDDHPLWSAEGVLAITGHVAGDSEQADELAARLAAEQLGRFVRGEPLRNVVDR